MNPPRNYRSSLGTTARGATGLTALAALALVMGLTACAPAESTDDRGSSGDASASDGDDQELDDSGDYAIDQRYTVTANSGLDPDAQGSALAVWNMFVDVATPEYIDGRVVAYEVGDNSASDVLGYVDPEEESDNDTWIFSANLAFADDEEELEGTIIHEYAHLISLDADQVDAQATTCDTIELSFGCAHEDAAIWAFQTAFWDAYGPDAPKSDNEDPDVGYDFYQTHEEDFVSDYAATNVLEDFAETFRAFVMEDEPGNTSPVAAKLRFFWDRDGEPERRDRIRSALGLN